MRIKDKLAKEDGKHIYCYKQGAFWVCYEQSAYIVNLSKGYKPTKKFIKNIAQEVVTIGFPEAALQQWVSKHTIKASTATDTLKVYKWHSTFIHNDFVKWKNTIALKENKLKVSSINIEEEVKSFSLATSTPTDAFLFLHSLQLKIKNT